MVECHNQNKPKQDKMFVFEQLWMNVYWLTPNLLILPKEIPILQYNNNKQSAGRKRTKASSFRTK